MSEHLNILVQPGSRATPIHSAGDALCTIKNTSLTDNVYLSTDVSININGTRFTTLRPLGTITLTGEVNTNAVTLTNPVNVELMPAINSTPAPSDIAAQIALQGVNVTISGVSSLAPSGDPSGITDTNNIKALIAGGAATLGKGIFNVLSSFTLPDGILFQGTQAATGYPTGNYGISGLPLTGTILKAVTGFSDPQMLLLTDGGAGQHGQ